MKKATAEKNNDSKKKQRCTNLREHRFVRVKIIDEKTHRMEVTDGCLLKKIHCIDCENSFKLEQGQASHK